ncbi:MAG TPA: YraN family protein [Chloroflexota bacterium]|nr:YraN family protein [Chloroflexota bacterium]
MPISSQTAELLPPPRSFAAHAWTALSRLAAVVPSWRRGQPRAAAHVTGARGEQIAYWSLRQHGYTIVARNFRLPGREGELDLIAFEGKPPALVFVEVKTRTRAGRFSAEDAVDVDKRRHLIRLARAYRRRRGYDGEYRFDVVAIYGPEKSVPRIELYRDAFRD